MPLLEVAETPFLPSQDQPSPGIATSCLLCASKPVEEKNFGFLPVDKALLRDRLILFPPVSDVHFFAVSPNMDETHFK